MEDPGLMDALRDIARGMGVADIAAAPAAAWGTDPLVSSRIPEGNRPSDIMPDARSVLVVGVPIQRDIISTTPSIWYNHLYGVVNSLIDRVTERLALELNIRGYHAVYVPRDGYYGMAGLMDRPEAFFSHRHAAYLAGMGTFGWNNLLLTERYGPRVRFGSVITDAVLPYGEVMTEELCIRCGRCARSCPGEAVGSDDYPVSIIDKGACNRVHSELNREGTFPCGVCAAVCPVGRDGARGPTAKGLENIRRFRKPGARRRCRTSQSNISEMVVAGAVLG